MKMICWNLRGIRGGRKIGEISKWVRQHRIGFLDLFETKNSGLSEQLGIRPYFKIKQVQWGSFMVELVQSGVTGTHSPTYQKRIEQPEAVNSNYYFN